MKMMMMMMITVTVNEIIKKLTTKQLYDNNKSEPN